MDKYVKHEKIGEGAYGVVYKGKNRLSKETVALKKIRLDSEENGFPASAMREICLLKNLNHPNIVELRDVLMTEKIVYLVFEYLPTDLSDFMDTYPSHVPLDPKLVKSYLHQIITAILYCHRCRVLHRDLKPQNLLLKSNGVIKIADFGLGRTIGIPIRAYTHEVITLWYRAPEILLGTKFYSCSVDIWSIGCIFAEMFNHKILFRGDSEIDQLLQIFRILKTPNKQIWPNVIELPQFKTDFPCWNENRLEKEMKNNDPVALNLLQEMFLYDPSKRISAKRILEHEYFNGFDNRLIPIAVK